MNPFAELAEAIVKMVVMDDFKHHLDDDYTQHPLEPPAEHFGHAIINTVLDILDPFDSHK